MRLHTLNRYTLSIILCAVFVMTVMGGCHRKGEETPSLNDHIYTAQNRYSYRFGAVHSRYADVYANPSMNAERLTQCVYGDVVRVVEEKEWWYAVKIGPYPELEGWIHKTVVTLLPSQASYLRERSLATIVIRQEQSEVFVWPGKTLEIAMGTELPFLGESGQWYLVRLPSNDVGRIERDAVYPAVEIQPSVQPLIQSKQEPPPKPVNIPKRRKDIILTAQKFLGKVYIWGGTTPRGFDCSGLSYFVYKLNGIELPRVSWLQYRTKQGKKVKKTDLGVGDLVFFETYKPGPSHVGIYIGNNQFIHASPSSGVTTSNLDEPYFKKRYIGAKTLFTDMPEG